MKKLLVLIPVLVCIVSLLAGCGNDKATDNQSSDVSFNATVQEVYDGSMLVEALTEEDAKKSAPSVIVEANNISSKTVNIGETVTITYNGGVSVGTDIPYLKSLNWEIMN